MKINIQPQNELSQQLEDYLVLDEQGRREYSLVFEGCKFPNIFFNTLVIPVKSRREVELLLLILGPEVTVFRDEVVRKLYPDVWEWLSGRTYSEVTANLKWSYREEDEVFDLIQKIPLPRTISTSFLKLHLDDPEPDPINQEYVHKVNPKNVLISKPFRSGNLFYFNGFNKSHEFNIDHSSHYFEQFFIFEVTRQTSIATTHLLGLPLDGALIILKTKTDYKKFVESDKPYLVRAITVFKLRGGLCYSVYNLIQDGESIMTGYMTALAYTSKQAYLKKRNKRNTATSD